MTTRLHVQIYGQVQGVSFRWYAQQRAQALGLAGWMRNRPDGSVEAMVQGPDEAVQEFVAWAREGPSAASVERVTVHAEEPREDEEGFHVAR